MTTLIQPYGTNKLRAYRISRHATLTNNNESTDDDNFWLRIIKNKNELAKVELISRVLYRTTSYPTISGFPLFDIGDTSNWSAFNSFTGNKPNTELATNNIIIIDFRHSTLEHRNFLNNGEFPELNYIIVRLRSSEEIRSTSISGIGIYMNYKFTGDIIGPIDFTEFNTNYCIMRTNINNSDGSGIQNTSIRLKDFFIYHRVNWFSESTSSVNLYNDLAFNVKIQPKYLTDNTYYNTNVYNNINLFSETGSGSGGIVNVTISASGNVTNINVSSGGSGYSNGDVVSINSSDFGGLDNMKILIEITSSILTTGQLNIVDLINNVLEEKMLVDSKDILIKDSHTVITSYYDDGVYISDEFFWCSLNRPRFLSLIVVSTLNADEIARDIPPNQRYNGSINGVNLITNNGVTTEVPVLRYIKNYVYDDIVTTYTTTSTTTTVTHIGNTGGGYRLNPQNLELTRETTIPYYYNNGINDNTSNTFKNLDVLFEYYSLNSSASNIWEMRTNGERANYFEIRYKPLFPLIDGVNSTSTGNIKIRFNFRYNELLTGPVNSKVTFERFEGMDGNLTPIGKNYKNALRSNEGEDIELEWNGENIDEKKMILIDIASGHSIHTPIITISNTNLFDSLNFFDFTINARVYQYRLLDRMDFDRDKYFNKAVVLFNETNQSELVLNNKQYDLKIVPEIGTNSENIIFDFDDNIERFSNGIDPLLLNPLNGGEENPTFRIDLNFEKIDMNSFNSSGIQGFSNANNILNFLALNENLLDSKEININKNSNGISQYIDSSGRTLLTNPIINIEMNNFSVNNISLGKGLVNNSEKDNEHYFSASNSFLLKSKYFLSDYWRFDGLISRLALSNTIDARFLEYENQYKTIATLLLVDIKLSGQIFLINTAKNKSHISYIPSITAINVESSVSGNPIVNFNNIDSVNPNINSSNPIFIKLTNFTTNTNSLFTSTKTAYSGVINNLTSNVGEVNQKLYPNKSTFDIVKIFKNNGDVEKIQSTPSSPTKYNGIYYFDIECGPSSNKLLNGYNLYPGKIMVNLVELPDIDKSETSIELARNNSFITITWPKFYYNSEQGEITWTIVRQDMANFSKVTRTYDINSSEINIVGDKIVYIDKEIRAFDKYQYTISGVFNFNRTTSNNTKLVVNGEFLYSDLSLEISGFTTDIVFVCFGYTRLFPFGRFNTTATNLKLFAPKLLRSNLNDTTKNLFASQLLVTNPAPKGYTNEEWLAQIKTWPNGRGECIGADGNTETFGRNLKQSSENIFANTTNQLSRKQTYVALARARFRPNR